MLVLDVGNIHQRYKDTYKVQIMQEGLSYDETDMLGKVLDAIRIYFLQERFCP